MIYYCKICGLNRVIWLKEQDKYATYCSKECEEKDKITLMKDEFESMVRGLNTFYHHVNRNNITTTLTYAVDDMVEFEAIKKRYGYSYDKTLDPL